MTKGELIKFLEPFSDEIQILLETENVLTNANVFAVAVNWRYELASNGRGQFILTNQIQDSRIWTDLKSSKPFLKD